MSIHQSFFLDKSIMYLGSGAVTQNASSGTSLVLNVPGETQPGDILFALVAASAKVNSITQASFSLLIDNTNTQQAPNILGRIVQDGITEPSTYTFTMANAASLSGVIFAYRNASLDKFGITATSAGGNLTVTGITPSKQNSVLLAAGNVLNTNETISAPSGMTLLIDGFSGDAISPDFAVFSQSNVPASATGNRTIGFSGGGNNGGFLWNIAPK